MENPCIFSKDRKFRYSLFHEWNRNRPSIAWIGLNPSTADESQLDPTLTRIKGFSERFGFGSFYMLNLFGYRATNPKDMFKHAIATGKLHRVDVIGALNDWYIQRTEEKVDSIVLAWGAHGTFADRDKEVISYLPQHKLYMLRKNANGTPAHPLYLPQNIDLKQYE